MLFSDIGRLFRIIVYLEQLDKLRGSIRGILIDVGVYQLEFSRVNRVGSAIADNNVRFTFARAACLQDVPKTFAIERGIQICIIWRNLLKL